MSDAVPPCWIVVPAAGVGARMGAPIPKQYLTLCGRPLLWHTLSRLCALPACRGIVLGISADDPHWPRLGFQHPRLLEVYHGGAQRAQTVLLGLRALASRAGERDLVLVHDAVRPCVHASDVERLLIEAARTDDGALLATPVTDTIKRADDRTRVDHTVSREGLWRALTPQAFPFAALRAALEAALNDGVTVSDEAAAMERLGRHPKLLQGRADNIKVTTPEDLALAELYLRRQETP